MIVPEYWAEAKVREKIAGSQVTIMRFGWSDSSEEDARKHAQTRAQEAMERARQGEKVRRFDHKLTYNGAEGLPIREEVVERHGDIVISRNLYGALCLNTPDVLFADIDFNDQAGTKLSFKVFISLALLSVVFGYLAGSVALFLGLAFVSMLFASTIAQLVFKMDLKRKGGAEKNTRNAIERYVEKHPESHLRLYRTPMGYRVLAMHRTFDPNDEDTLKLLQDLNADPIYVRMCKNQKCFRARVSPKPWRIGIDRLGPRPGVWPIKAERMAERRQWVAEYTRKAGNFAACRFEKSYGSGTVDATAEFVRALHDDFCMADRNLAIA